MYGWKGIFLVSALDSRRVLVTVYLEYLRIIVHNLLANDGDPF